MSLTGNQHYVKHNEQVTIYCNHKEYNVNIVHEALNFCLGVAQTIQMFLFFQFNHRAKTWSDQFSGIICVLSNY